MTWRPRLGRAASVLPVVAAVTIACGGGRDGTTGGAGRQAVPTGEAAAGGASRAGDRGAAGTVALAPTELPDLSRVEPALRERVMARQASLAAVTGSPAASPEARASAYGEVGKLLLAAEFYDAAEPYFANARVLAPADRRWPYYLGHVLRLRQDPAGAVQAFEAARRLKDDDVPTLAWLGRLQIDQGRTADGAALLERVLALDPGSALAHAALGRAALGERRYQEAVDHLERALASAPAALGLHYPLAGAYRGLGQAAQADAHLRLFKDVDISANDPLMDEVGRLLQTSLDYTVRGTRALDARRWAEAAALFRKGLELSPADPILHSNLGTALFLSGDEAAAVPQFEEALRLLPGYAKAHFNLGVIFDAAGRDDEAVAHLAQAVASDPALVDARLTLADALRRTGRPEAALEHYAAILRTDPGASRARFGQAMALVRLRRFGEARASLEAGTAAYPDQPGFAHALARVLAAAPDDGVREGRRALAIADGLRARYRSPAVTETVAMAQAEVGQFTEAVATQRAAIAEARQAGLPAGPQLAENLERYLQRLPCRTPWRDDDPVHRPRAARASG